MSPLACQDCGFESRRGMNVLWVVRQRSLCRADHSTRGFLRVWCVQYNERDRKAVRGSCAMKRQQVSSERNKSKYFFFLQLDEGGPLVCGGKLTGILSHSVNCGKENKPSVYTDLAQHRAWIKQRVPNLPAASVRNSMSYVTIAAMLAALASLWSCRT